MGSLNKSPRALEERRARFAQRFLSEAPKITLVANRMLRGGGETADVVQQIFLNLLERLQGSEVPLEFEELSDQELRAYLARAIRNYAIDLGRKRESIRKSYQEIYTAIEGPSTPEEQLISSESEDRLRASVETLKPPYRLLLRALIEEDTSLAELARKRKIKVGTIYTQFRRALEALRGEWFRRSVK